MSPWGMIQIPKKKTHSNSNASFYSENIPSNQSEGRLGDIHAHILHPRNMHDNEQSGTGKKTCLVLIAYCHFHLPRIHPPQGKAIKLEHNQPEACLFVRYVVCFFFQCSTRMENSLHVRLILCLDSVHIFHFLLIRILYCWLMFGALNNVHSLVASWSFFSCKIIKTLNNSNEDLMIINKNSSTLPSFTQLTQKLSLSRGSFPDLHHFHKLSFP